MSEKQKKIMSFAVKEASTPTIEEMVEEFWKMLASNQFVKSTNSVTDEVEEYPPAIVDMEATVAINGEFDKYDIEEWLRNALTTIYQNAREEERDRILKIANRNADAFMLESTYNRFLEAVLSHPLNK